IEMGGPGGLARQGWVPKTLTPGMKIDVTIHPLRDGSHGVQVMAVKLPDGTQLGNREAPPRADAGAGPAPATQQRRSFLGLMDHRLPDRSPVGERAYFTTSREPG